MISNEYELAANSVEEFASKNHTFKNSLIENINDKCYELLDDLLIELDDEIYYLNKEYYERL